MQEETRKPTIDTRNRHWLELVAAYLGATPDELALQLHRGMSADGAAERYGRPRVGVQELLATHRSER